MLALFGTLFDIVRLRKGPDAIPHSGFLFAIVAMLWLLAGAVITGATPGLGSKDFVIGTLTGIAGLLCYTAFVVLAGRRARLLQTVMALLGCGALLSLSYVVGNTALAPLLGESPAGIITTLILLWTVPVEGHIISRAIDRHWYVGVVMAMAVFIFQLMLYSMLDPTAAVTG